MQTFTGYEYLMIDAANQMGHDKWLFDDRIQWVKDNMDSLESLADQADKKPLYLKAVQAIRKAQAGQPTGHLVGFDAVCSGIQVMSALTGCKAGAEATGLINPNVRADAYTATTKIMNSILGGVGVSVPRKKAKEALMTAYYGSKAKPVEIFGEDTPELTAFYAAATQVAPGAWELLQDLLKSWQPYALTHEWQLPDGYEAKVKVMEKVQTRIEVDELDHASFTYEFKFNQGSPKGLSNVANVVHSVDAYILRCIHRRCNYDLKVATEAYEWITEALSKPEFGDTADPMITYYKDLYERSGVADVVILPYLNSSNVHNLTYPHLEELAKIVHSMLSHRPFEVVTVHDEFKCHANNMNHLRQHYINIFCDLANGCVLDMIFTDLFGKQVRYQKLSEDLSEHIAQSNYALT